MLTGFEDPGAAAHLRALRAPDVPVEPEARRPQQVRIRQLLGRVLHGVAVLVAERQRVGIGVGKARVGKRRHVHAQAEVHFQVARHAPVILRVGAEVEHLERLDRLLHPGDIVPAHLEDAQRHGGHRAVRVRKVPVHVGVEVGQRVVRVDALRAREEHVFRLVALEATAEGHRVLAAEPGEVVLHLERVVPELVVRRERLEAERRVDRPGLEDVHEREERPARGAAFVLFRIAHDEAVGDLVAQDRVPLADDRADVLENLVVRVLEIQARRVGAARAEAERRGVGDQHVGDGVQLVVANAQLVPVIEVVIDLEQIPLGRRQAVVGLERTRLVLEVGRQETAELYEIRLEHARGAADGRFSANVCPEGRPRLRERLVLVVAEDEHLVLHDRARSPSARVAEVDVPGFTVRPFAFVPTRLSLRNWL